MVDKYKKDYKDEYKAFLELMVQRRKEMKDKKHAKVVGASEMRNAVSIPDKLIGVLTYVGLILLGIPYALPIAVLSGLLEAVPNIGPVVSAIPAILIGLTVSPITGLGVTILGVLIQQLENNLIVPRVMQAATGTKPLITILVLLVGYTLGGIAGAVLSMPLFLTITTAYEHVTKNN